MTSTNKIQNYLKKKKKITKSFHWILIRELLHQLNLQRQRNHIRHIE